MSCVLSAPMPEEFPEFLLTDPDITREMTVGYAPGDLCCQTPMLKLANKYLLDAGFGIGARVSVHYQRNKVVIRKI